MFREPTSSSNRLPRSADSRSLPGPAEAEVQRKRMLIALGILLVALAAVIIKDWDFWFPSSGDGTDILANYGARAQGSEDFDTRRTGGTL